MKKNEALKLVFTVRAAYPVYYRNVSQGELEAMADLWAAVLEDYTFEQAFLAVKTYLRSGNKEILQSPGQVVDEIEKLKKAGGPDDMTPAKAWAIVRPAIRRGIYHSEEDFELFPEIVQKAVGSSERLMEWAQLPSSTIDSVLRSDFCNRMFPAVAKEAEQDARLPANVRMMIERKRQESEEAESNRITNISSHAERRLVERPESDGVDFSKEHAERIHAELMRRREARKARKAE